MYILYIVVECKQTLYFDVNKDNKNCHNLKEEQTNSKALNNLKKIGIQRHSLSLSSLMEMLVEM